MRVGIHFIPTVGPDDKVASAYYDECLDLAAQADRLGYASVKIGEHYLFDYGGYSPDPIAFLSAAAQRTTGIRLATGGVFPAFTHPVKLASQLAMLDNLSHGRLDVGFARAFLPEEFDAFQVPLDESGSRFEEGIQAIRWLWTHDEAEWNGQRYQFGPLRILPRPAQQPHPPIWITATYTPELFEWSGKQGHNLMLVPYVSPHETVSNLLTLYRGAWEQAGHTPGQERIQLTIHCYLADGENVEEARPYFEDYRAKLLRAIEPWSARRTPEYPGYEHLAAAVHKLTYDVALEQGKLLVGSPNQVVAQLRQLLDWYGDFEPALLINFGNMPIGRGQRTLELFAKQVMPRF